MASTKLKAELAAKHKAEEERAAAKAKAQKTKDDAKADVLLVLEQDKVKALTKLAGTAKEINERLDRAAVADKKGDDHRLAAALKLEEARKLCVEKGIKFKEWVESNVTQKWETVRKLVAIGGSPEPAKALADLREKVKAANKKLNAKKAAGSKSSPLKGGAHSAFKAADDAVAALDEKQQTVIVAERAAKLGLTVAPKGKVVSGLDAVKRAFLDTLEPQEKVAFVTWAANEIGVSVKDPFDSPAATPAPVPVDGEMPPIPEAMRRSRKRS